MNLIDLNLVACDTCALSITKRTKLINKIECHKELLMRDGEVFYPIIFLSSKDGQNIDLGPCSSYLSKIDKPLIIEYPYTLGLGEMVIIKYRDGRIDQLKNEDILTETVLSNPDVYKAMLISVTSGGTVRKTLLI